MRNAQLIFIFFLVTISQCATACSQIDKGKWHDEKETISKDGRYHGGGNDALIRRHDRFRVRPG